MNLSETVSIPAEVMARSVGDETVLLDLSSGTYFGLDPVGARIWALMSEGMSLRTVCDVIQGEYDVTRDALEADVLRLLGELRAKGLVRAG